MNENNLGDFKYFIDHDNRIIYMERHDALTKKAVYAEWSSMQELDGFDPSYDSIVDYSFVTCVDVDASDLMELNREMPKHDVRTGNIALVSGLAQRRYMLAVFFCHIANLIGSRRKYMVFNTKAEAELWLFSQRQ